MVIGVSTSGVWVDERHGHIPDVDMKMEIIATVGGMSSL